LKKIGPAACTVRKDPLKKENPEQQAVENACGSGLFF